MRADLAWNGEAVDGRVRWVTGFERVPIDAVLAMGDDEVVDLPRSKVDDTVHHLHDARIGASYKHAQCSDRERRMHEPARAAKRKRSSPTHPPCPSSCPRKLRMRSIGQLRTNDSRSARANHPR